MKSEAVWRLIAILLLTHACMPGFICSSLAQPVTSVNTPAQNALGLEQTIGNVQLNLIGERNYQLSSIDINDIDGQSRQAIRTPQSSGIAVVTGNRLTVDFAFPDSPPPPFINRRIERIWRVTSTADQSLPNPPVTIQWDGTQQAMSASDGGRALPVMVTPFVQDQGIDETTGLTYWEGGVQLQIPIDQLRGAIRYSGQLVIFMETF